MENRDFLDIDDVLLTASSHAESVTRVLIRFGLRKPQQVAHTEAMFLRIYLQLCPLRASTRRTEDAEGEISIYWNLFYDGEAISKIFR